MELTIDGKVCDLGSIRIAVPGYDAARLSDPEACRTGRRLECRIPATPRNDRLLGSPLDPHAGGRFNDEPHEAAVTAQGAVLLTGWVRLLSSSEEEYTIEIRDGGAGWAENTARRMFNTLGIDYAGHLTPTEICAGWRDASPVKFFPIHRDEYPRRNGSSRRTTTTRSFGSPRSSSGCSTRRDTPSAAVFSRTTSSARST